VLSAQFVTQTHPPSSSAQEELLGQLDVCPHELEHMPPGNWPAPSGLVGSQSPSSHSVAPLQGPPTKLLSLPAKPGGRPSPPQASRKEHNAGAAKATVKRIIEPQT
jgi:hypothetical protein